MRPFSSYPFLSINTGYRRNKVTYRVFFKYCVFSQEFSIFCDLSLAARTGLLLVVQKMTVHWDLRSDELISCKQGMGCSKFGKNTIFNEHPVAPL